MSTLVKAKKKSMNPLADWPGGAKPNTAENLNKNIVEARKRWDVCIAKKSTAWQKVMESSEVGFIQPVTQWRDEAEKEGAIAVKLERLMELWEQRLAELRVTAPVAPKAAAITYHNPSPWS